MTINQELLTSIKNNHFREQTLSLNEAELTDEDIVSLVDALKYNHYIKQLELEANFISSLGAQSLATLSTLESLNVGGNNIEAEGAIALAKSSLKRLNIVNNPIGEGITAFVASPLLFKLNAAACPNLTDTGIAQLFLSKSIKNLNLSKNQLSGKCLEHLVSNDILEALDFSANNIEKNNAILLLKTKL